MSRPWLRLANGDYVVDTIKKPSIAAVEAVCDSYRLPSQARRVV